MVYVLDLFAGDRNTRIETCYVYYRNVSSLVPALVTSWLMLSFVLFFPAEHDDPSPDRLAELYEVQAKGSTTVACIENNSTAAVVGFASCLLLHAMRVRVICSLYVVAGRGEFFCCFVSVNLCCSHLVAQKTFELDGLEPACRRNGMRERRSVLFRACCGSNRRRGNAITNRPSRARPARERVSTCVSMIHVEKT